MTSSEADLPCNSNSIFLNLITTYECSDIIARLKPLCQGMNIVSGNLIKSVRDIICQLLTELINCSFERGNFPKSLKLACVTPLFN